MTLEAHKESDQKVLDEASLHNYNNSSRRFSDQPDFVLGQPLKVSWETVEEMTFGFRTRILADEKSDYSVYEGFWEPVYGSQVMVMRYNTTACTSTSPGNSRGVLEAEKKAALSMHHKNILSLAGYCNCDNTMILIFPSAKRGSLETNLYDSKKAKTILLDEFMQFTVSNPSLNSFISFLTSQPEVKKRIADGVEDRQEAVAVTTAIQEEIFLEMGIDPRFGLSCLGKVNVEYENDQDVMIQFYKFIAREEMACDEAELGAEEFAEKMHSQEQLQEQQLEMLKHMRKFPMDDQSAILEKLHQQMENANFDGAASVLSPEQIQEIVRRRVSPLFNPR